MTATPVGTLNCTVHPVRPVDEIKKRLALVEHYVANGSDAGFIEYIDEQAQWARDTFGSGERVLGIVEHIRKELVEVLADPTDVTEWADIIILALDGASRQGFTGNEIVDALYIKFAKNQLRKWPPLSEQHPDKATEHVRD